MFDECMPGMLVGSKRLILDCTKLPSGTPDAENIATFFTHMEQRGLNPRLPEHRQTFNDRFLLHTGARYAVSAYGEDRSAMLRDSAKGGQGRTIHLGIDIFCRGLEAVIAPCNGRVVYTGRESEPHSFGNFVIFKPDADALPLLFLAHLSFKQPPLGRVQRGEVIAQLGDYMHNENGGWSRHLHVQCLREMPAGNVMPKGYATAENFATESQRYPDPMSFFPGWTIR